MTDHREVTLALGDGCGVTARFLREEILSRFPNPSLAECEDASHLWLGGDEMVISTDSFLVDPPFFPGGDIARLAVAGTVNDLLASGGEPRFLTLGLVVTEGFPFADLQRLLTSLAESCEAASVEVVAGDTKVLERRAGVGILINMTGVGAPVRPGCRYRLADAKAGDKLLVTGYVGDHGLAVLSEREGLGFEQRLRSDCAPLGDLLLPILRQQQGIHALRDPTRGGLAGVLHDLTEATRLDVAVACEAVPVRDEVRFGCEMLGLDPLEMINEGKMVIAVAPEEVRSTMERLGRHPRGRSAAVIGEMRAAQRGDSCVWLEDHGRERVLLRRDGPRLPRLC